MRDHRTLAYFLLRLSFGVLFLVFGLQKLALGPATFANALAGQFANSPLPASLAYVFGLFLPFLEIAIGIFVTLGLFTVPALVGSALLLIALNFGLLLSGQGQTVPGNFAYVLTNFILLFAAEHNRYSLDRKRRP